MQNRVLRPRSCHVHVTVNVTIIDRKNCDRRRCEGHQTTNTVRYCPEDAWDIVGLDEKESLNKEDRR